MSRRISASRARRLRAEEADRLLGAVFREFLAIDEVATYLDQWTIHIDPAAIPPIQLERRTAQEADHGSPQP